MKSRIAIVVALCCLSGCSNPPVVTKGTFTTPYTLTIQRGSFDIVVQTSGPGSYVIKNYPMDHPMGPRPDTEATFTTPAGVFNISDRNDSSGVTINGTHYPHAGPGTTARTTITIDAQGVVSVTPPKAGD